ncbi:reverse transcriptase [Quillaja saponaria]|uniref:Reverse transcriptase n=1 Tax=Quillaja saponaria TaxID=32244 RepID=A0AAD7Q0Z3_QUISA|nr:reverse transcriptase [Quillaja saponaria]
MVRELHPDIIFLSETKIQSSLYTDTLNMLGFPQITYVELSNTAGGFYVACATAIHFTLVSSSKNIIHLTLHSSPPDKTWNLLAVYGPPYNEEKLDFWNCISSLYHSFTSLTLLIRDFNSYLLPMEKQSSAKCGPSIIDICRTINALGVVDLGFTGNTKIHLNSKERKANTKIHLNRAFASTDWRLLFPRAVLTHLFTIASDHNPILLKMEGEPSFQPCPFKFEEIWTRDDRSKLVVENSWKNHTNGSHAFSLNHKLKRARAALKDWNRNEFGKVQARIKTLKCQIDILQRKEPTHENLLAEHCLKTDLDERALREEIFWKQKSIVQWLKQGDKNTLFFHLSTVIRRRRNVIDFLKLSLNNWTSRREDIGQAFVNHFTQTFTSSNSSFPADLNNLFLPCISKNNNVSLCTTPNKKEIKSIIFNMNSNKALGPDGFSAKFYKHY